MISIEPKLAQEIVERAAKIIPFNVNVMDRRGIIVGSGKPARIGELHAGAQLALAQACTVVIDEAMARTLPTVEAGVNLPLTVRGRICGVVGLTGEPETVQPFGELLRTTVEMLLEQTQLLGELQREKRYREEFVSHLVSRERRSPVDLNAWALRLGIEFRSPHAAIVVTLEDADRRADLSLVELQRFQARLAAQLPDLPTAVLSPREFVMLESFGGRAPQTSEASHARLRLQYFETILRAETTLPFVLSLGVALPDVESVALSYQSACRTRHVGRQRRPEAAAFSFYELSLPVLLSSLDASWQAEQLRRPLDRLMRIDKRQRTLRHTLDTWFAHDGRSLSTAKALGIHRNTLDYRLRQIGKATGLDLDRTDDRLLLYIALQFDGQESAG
jgi:carbohydrate diacid regulator